MTSGARNAGANLVIEKLAKNFGGLKVFEDIDFNLPAGSVLGVIGPNGAGKTTLINTICGMIKPTSGSVLLNGEDISGQPFYLLSKKGLVRSFQQTNTFRNVSVRENILRAIKFSDGSADTWTMLAGMLETYDLASRLDEQSDSLPYGLQKMLGLILAFATRPKVLLLDEPAAGLETRERKNIDDYVMQVRDQLHCSVLIVEHDMDLIKRLCPQVVVLDAGKLLAAGPPGEVLSRKDVIDAYLGASDDEDI